MARVLREGRSVPRGLKPASLLALGGATGTRALPELFAQDHFPPRVFHNESFPSETVLDADALIARPGLLIQNLAERGEEAIYFLDSVVVDEADAEEAAGFFHVEALG